uniref:Uncharacterized protein n=1 Tax=Arundo donax TaxID=35708 RepID=A0A0A9I1Q2_ARUDO
MAVSSALSSWLVQVNCTLCLNVLPSFTSPSRTGK